MADNKGNKFGPNVPTGKNFLPPKKEGDEFSHKQVHGPAADVQPQVATQVVPGSPLEAQLNYLAARGWVIEADDGFGHFLLSDPKDAVLRDPKHFNAASGMNEYPVLDNRKSPPIPVRGEDGNPKVFKTPNEHREAVELPSKEGPPQRIKQWHGPALAWSCSLIQALQIQRARDNAGETPEQTIARKERELADMKAAHAREREAAAKAAAKAS